MIVIRMLRDFFIILGILGGFILSIVLWAGLFAAIASYFEIGYNPILGLMAVLTYIAALMAVIFNL